MVWGLTWARSTPSENRALALARVQVPSSGGEDGVLLVFVMSNPFHDQYDYHDYIMAKGARAMGKSRLAWTTILTEILGEILVLAGALVPLVSIPMAIVLLVAIFTVHLPYGFSSVKLQEITPHGAHFGQPGYETDLLYLACLVALVLGGSGPLAVDGWLLRRSRGLAGG